MDLCEKCYDATLKGKDTTNEKIYQMADSRGHDIDKHVYLRLVRNGSFIP